MRLADCAYVELPETSGNIIKDIENLYYKNNKEATWAHVCKVAKTCEQIAIRYNLDIEVCQLAAYLHDISAIIKPADMLDYYKKTGKTLDEAELKHPFLLHQRMSKVIAKDHFNVTDERILSAIHYHTTLRSNPSPYDMAVFIADKLSWDKEAKPPFYEVVEDALEISLQTACLAYLDYVFSNEMIVCPHTWAIEAQKYLRQMVLNTIEPATPYDIILVGGASGVGKSMMSDQLAKRLGMNVVLVNDFQCIVEHFTREEDYPVFHYWTKHFEDAVKLPMEKKLEVMISYANAMTKALELVIENHLEENRPMILEGDFISPQLCKKLLADPNKAIRIKCIFITEDDQEQICQNYYEREQILQKDRSLLSWHYNNWLKEQSKDTAVLHIPSRPWDTLPDRVMRQLETLKTPRCTLRRISAGDFPLFLKLQTDPQVKAHLGGPVNPEQVPAKFSAMLCSEHDYWVVSEKASGKAMGIVSVDPYHDTGNFELSYTFLPESWGQGFAHEAVHHITAYCFETLNHATLFAETQTRNAKSKRLLSKLEWTEVETLTRFGESQTVYQIMQR